MFKSNTTVLGCMLLDYNGYKYKPYKVLCFFIMDGEEIKKMVLIVYQSTLTSSILLLLNLFFVQILCLSSLNQSTR